MATKDNCEAAAADDSDDEVATPHDDARRRHLLGASLALGSGALFTFNGFIVNRLQVSQIVEGFRKPILCCQQLSVPSIILVRTVLQVTLYTAILLHRWGRGTLGFSLYRDHLIKGRVVAARTAKSENTDHSSRCLLL